ncbi:hypothetical protein DMH03_31475 [Amycolatopsis sp. WAC 01376]|uniref:hypothetical protein n=1 Tax=Amycolatopsis sp. WAC 01376 TaxID=2203195 RepID=UPI000F780A2C|nr:hypothetical protein [Amycolatopsis sp. WAC 01376]RSM56043.1 hypothetical protein DMH03_31475 [Amycolatopsis sp. WAC 01376]
MSDFISIDIDELTIDEIEAVEEIIDASIESVAKPGSCKGKFLHALAFVVKRREDPAFTIEQAGSLKIRVERPAGKPDPTVPAAQ